MPAWLLKMREKLEGSESYLTKATNRIEGLSASVEKLSENIDKILLDSPRTMAVKKRQTQAILASSGGVTCEMDENSDDHDYKRQKLTIECLFSSEMWGYVISFLPFMDMLVAEGICKPIRALHEDGIFFSDRRLFPSSLFDGDYKSKLRSRGRCYWFIQRTKKNLVTPAERIFQLNNMFTASCSSTDDFSYFHEDTISVLVGFLTHQNGAIRDLSCGIIGNLLCWEQYQEGLNPIRPVEQAKAQNAVRKFCSLLTSPSASVNLAQSKTELTYEREHSIRSISARRGARALVNIFSDYPVPEESTPCKDILPAAGLQYMFCFYHKSGASKESYLADFYVDEEGGVLGSTDDAMNGPTRMRGKAVQDIDGQVYLFKNYPQAPDSNSPYLNVVAYWSNGVAVPGQGVQYGRGFYGIWENFTSEPHFELKKGGIFRAIPLM